MFAPRMQYRDGRPNDPINIRMVGELPRAPFTPVPMRADGVKIGPVLGRFVPVSEPVPRPGAYMDMGSRTPTPPSLRRLVSGPVRRPGAYTDRRAKPENITPVRSLGGGPSPADLANIQAENAAYQAKIASGELVRDPGQVDQGPPRYVTSDQAIKIQAKLDQARQADLSMTPEERSIRSRSLINAQESAARDFMPVKPFSPVDQSGGRPMPQPVLTPQPQPFQPQPATPQFGQVQQQPQFNQQGMQQMMQFMQQMMQMFSMMSGQGGQGGFGGGFNQRPPMFGGGYGGGMGGGFGRGGYQQFQQPQQRPMPRYPRMQNNYSQSPFGGY